MTRLLAWAKVNQIFMALNNTGDERHAREGNMGSVISLKPDWETCRTAYCQTNEKQFAIKLLKICYMDECNQQLRM